MSIHSQSGTSFKTIIRNVKETCRRKNESHTLEKSNAVNPVFLGDKWSVAENFSTVGTVIATV